MYVLDKSNSCISYKYYSESSITRLKDKPVNTLSVIHFFNPLIVVNIVFGWVDFRGDGKYRKENLSFPLFGNEWKMGGVENQGENFLPGLTKFFPPKLGGKAMR